MVGIIRLYNDSYGNEDSRIYCQLSKYFDGILITDNKAIHKLEKYDCITFNDAINNIAKFNKLIVYNSRPTEYGGSFAYLATRLILEIEQLYLFSSDNSNLHKYPTQSVINIEKAVNRLNSYAIRLNYTDFIHYYGASHTVLKRLPEKKEWYTCYFGDLERPENLERLNNHFKTLTKKFVIGYEHEEYPWFDFRKDYLEKVCLAYTIPIFSNSRDILYQIWHTNTVALVNSEFKVEGLDESFYFSNPEEFHAKALIISTQEIAYARMLKIQRNLLTKLKQKYGKTTFKWSSILKQKKAEELERRKLIDGMKQKQVESAKKRLTAHGIKFNF